MRAFFVLCVRFALHSGKSTFDKVTTTCVFKIVFLSYFRQYGHTEDAQRNELTYTYKKITTPAKNTTYWIAIRK